MAKMNLGEVVLRCVWQSVADIIVPCFTYVVTCTTTDETDVFIRTIRRRYFMPPSITAF